MIGLVLCGGQSTRMGTDKGLLLQRNKSWGELAAEKLQSLNIPVKYSVNNSQELVYGNLFGKENLILDHQELAIGGPLKGILSAHLAQPTADFFVLACDLVMMNITVMKKLMKIKETEKEYEAYAYANTHFYEPLCAIYTGRGLARIAKTYQEGHLMKYSLQAVLKELNTYKITLAESELDVFKNFNSPNEI
jgi:molybdenum cofactor guanylyltransferase